MSIMHATRLGALHICCPRVHNIMTLIVSNYSQQLQSAIGRLFFENRVFLH